mmetsp:Transcript_6854/g.19222  ORF Transcript_6854/g.19222 Transcript_6854/m.19222 type:complete len:219 (-) Transcript_6854:32-688(-)
MASPNCAALIRRLPFSTTLANIRSTSVLPSFLSIRPQSLHSLRKHLPSMSSCPSPQKLRNVLRTPGSALGSALGCKSWRALDSSLPPPLPWTHCENSSYVTFPSWFLSMCSNMAVMSASRNLPSDFRILLSSSLLREPVLLAYLSKTSLIAEASPIRQSRGGRRQSRDQHRRTSSSSSEMLDFLEWTDLAEAAGLGGRPLPAQGPHPRRGALAAARCF